MAIENPPAFPSIETHPSYDMPMHHFGMSLRDYFVGQAMLNPAICTGTASDWQLQRWFGPHRTGITRGEVMAKQAGELADAMLAERAKEKAK